MSDHQNPKTYCKTKQVLIVTIRSRDIIVELSGDSGLNTDHVQINLRKCYSLRCKRNRPLSDSKDLSVCLWSSRSEFPSQPSGSRPRCSRCASSRKIWIVGVSALTARAVAGSPGGMTPFQRSVIWNIEETPLPTQETCNRPKTPERVTVHQKPADSGPKSDTITKLTF